MPRDQFVLHLGKLFILWAVLYKIGALRLIDSFLRLIFQTNHPVPILIMENMITLGYTTIKDRSQISFESATMLIEKLAQFHATSFMLNWQKDESVAQLDEVYFDYHMDESCIDEFDQRIGMMKEMNGFENVVAKLEGSTTEMFRHVRKLYNNADDAACKVLCHGDMKFENTMVKMNENGVENAIFVSKCIEFDFVAILAQIEMFHCRSTLPMQIITRRPSICTNFCIKYPPWM